MFKKRLLDVDGPDDDSMASEMHWMDMQDKEHIKWTCIWMSLVFAGCLFVSCHKPALTVDKQVFINQLQERGH